jgi:hypothetical protein
LEYPEAEANVYAQKGAEKYRQAKREKERVARKIGKTEMRQKQAQNTDGKPSLARKLMGGANKITLL